MVELGALAIGRGASAPPSVVVVSLVIVMLPSLRSGWMLLHSTAWLREVEGQA